VFRRGYWHPKVFPQGQTRFPGSSEKTIGDSWPRKQSTKVMRCRHQGRGKSAAAVRPRASFTKPYAHPVRPLPAYLFRDLQFSVRSIAYSRAHCSKRVSRARPSGGHAALVFKTRKAQSGEYGMLTSRDDSTSESSSLILSSNSSWSRFRFTDRTTSHRDFVRFLAIRQFVGY
jgi:hypothetical protein